MDKHSQGPWKLTPWTHDALLVETQLRQAESEAPIINKDSSAIDGAWFGIHPADAYLLLAAPDLLDACRRAMDEMGAEVAADCAWCGGEGGWTEGKRPRMTPVRHRENCPILVIRAAIAKAEGR